MKKISSNQFILRKIFPIIWFGGLGFFLLTSLITKAYEKNIIFIIQPCLMALFGYFLFKKLIWDLVDEVFDCGDYLLIKYRNDEDKILLSNIMNISGMSFSNPPRATLTLAQPSKFGKELTFSPLSPLLRFNPFAKNAVVEDLIVRIDTARLNRKI
jgi:hypothetical protein